MVSQGKGSSKKDDDGSMDPKIPDFIHELLEDVVIPPLLFG